MTDYTQYPTTKKDALATGQKYYYTGIPCINGHDDIRSVVDNGCTACKRERAKKRYERSDVKARQQELRREKQEHYKEYNKQYRQQHPERAAEYNKRANQARRVKCMNDLRTLLIERCNSAKQRAKAKQLDYNLTIDYVLSIYPTDNRCPVFGVEFDFSRSNPSLSPTIDRIDNNRGYVEGNVWFICGRANTLKNDSNLVELKMLVEALTLKLDQLSV